MRSVSSIVQMIATAIAISTCEPRRADGAGRTAPDAAATFTVAMCCKLTTVRVLDILLIVPPFGASHLRSEFALRDQFSCGSAIRSCVWRQIRCPAASIATAWSPRAPRSARSDFSRVTMKKHSFILSTIADVFAVAALLGAIGCAAARRPAESAPSPAVAGSSEGLAPPRRVSPATSPAESRRAEFEYRRIHAAAGQFITESELARDADFPLFAVLVRHLRGFTNFRDGRVVNEADIPSQLDVYVNGLRSFGLDVRPRDLMGVEYYQASDAPVSYRRPFKSAPVLLLWLKP